ncbi:serine hydrolase [Actinomycetes bacterium KLBMP 9797]
MSMGTSGLTALLEAEAARFTLEVPDDTAATGVVELESLRARKPLGVGVYVKHLTTGEEAAVRADVAFEAQSVIKVALAIRSYQLADDGWLDLDERVRVVRSDLRGGSGLLRYFQEGLEPTVRDLLTAMIVISDNSAADLLLTKIGGVTELNAWLAASGYRQASMAQSVLDGGRLPYVLADSRHASLTSAQVYALRNGDPQWAGMTREWLRSIERKLASLAARPLGEVRALARERGLPLCFGRMTPREAGRMLESIERATAVSSDSSAQLRAALRRQQLGERRLPRLIEHPVGHKTGDSPPWDANDVGIVYAPSGPIVVAVFANDLGGDYQEEEDRIGRIGRVILDYFERDPDLA